jgi:hypothetical protein
MMKVRVSFSGSDRYHGTVYRVRPGQVVDLPDGLAEAYISAGVAEQVKSDGPAEMKVVAPPEDASTQPDETPQDEPDETPADTADADKDADGVVELGGGWYQLPDGTKQRGRP